MPSASSGSARLAYDAAGAGPAVLLRSEDPGEEADPGPAWDRLDEIRVPALVLCGDLDVFSLPLSEHVAASIPGATYEVLEGTAHLPHLEGHRRCLDVITAFLTEVSST